MFGVDRPSGRVDETRMGLRWAPSRIAAAEAAVLEDSPPGVVRVAESHQVRVAVVAARTGTVNVMHINGRLVAVVLFADGMSAQIRGADPAPACAVATTRRSGTRCHAATGSSPSACARTQ